MSNFVFLLCQSIFLSGFSIELFLTGASANWLINGTRSTADCLEDIAITEQISRKLADDLDCEEKSNITVVSYHKLILLVGQTTDESVKQKAHNYAAAVPKIKGIFNQVVIQQPSGMLRRFQGKFLWYAIGAKLVLTSYIRYHHFKIIVENGEVFMLGKAQRNEVDLAVAAIQKIMGVKKIVKLIEIL